VPHLGILDADAPVPGDPAAQRRRRPGQVHVLVADLAGNGHRLLCGLTAGLPGEGRRHRRLPLLAVRVDLRQLRLELLIEQLMTRRVPAAARSTKLIPCAQPVLMIICPGSAAAARTRRRYPASTSHSTVLPRGSPYPRSAEATSPHARRERKATGLSRRPARATRPGPDPGAFRRRPTMFRTGSLSGRLALASGRRIPDPVLGRQRRPVSAQARAAHGKARDVTGAMPPLVRRWWQY
jgi:hypothetical protein